MNTCLQNSVAESSPGFSSRKTHPLSVSTLAEIHYVIVFGYPPDKYSVTVEYFKSIGDTTEPDPNTQITNCFRIGYRDFGEGMRAVKRNGEILSGSYMVGAKWAVSSIVPMSWWPANSCLLRLQDPARAGELLAQNTGRGLLSSVSGADVGSSQLSANPMVVDEISPPPTHSNTPMYGTPIRLAPATSAFRKPGQSPMQVQKAVVPVPQNTPTSVGIASGLPVGQSPGKGMLSQVSDLIFGW